MTRAARSMILLLIAPAALQAQSASMTITLQHDSEDERAAKQQLERILKAYDIERWTSTRAVLIDRTATPHSHPVLTLNSRVQSDTNQLATFLHEQFHWFEEQRQDSTDAAMAVFRELYPDAPAGGSQGARNHCSTYLHLIVCDLEYQAVTKLFGEQSARALLARKPYYRWIYDRVLNDPRVRATNERLGFIVQ